MGNNADLKMVNLMITFIHKSKVDSQFIWY